VIHPSSVAVSREHRRAKTDRLDTELLKRGFSGASPVPYAPFVAAFHQGLSEAGYVEGQNVAIEYRWAEGRYDRMPALAADLVGRKVDVIAAGGDTAVLAAKSATSTIPIVFFSGSDPAERGLVASLARPGGNVTGVTFMTGELMPKRLELVSELVPEARVIALLVCPLQQVENMERTAMSVLSKSGPACGDWLRAR
jgi:putative ABC transport system substrate-binding protein